MAYETGYRHGVYVSEVDTAIISPIVATMPTVVFGTAPIHVATTPADANTPVLCHTLAEFTAAFGWSNDFEKYTLCEAARVQFQIYAVSPVIFVNVLDKTEHVKNSGATIEGVSSPITLSQPILLSTLEITSGADESLVELVADTDFTAAHDKFGNAQITILSQNKVVNDTISVTWKEITPLTVTAEDIIGGVDNVTGKYTGLELVEEIYPRFKMIPGTIIVPKFSTNSAVAAVMAAKCEGINGCFKAMAIADLPTDTLKNYSNVGQVKTANNYSNPLLIATYPKVSLGGTQYFLSNHVAALLNKTDAAHDNLPYKSPSNESLMCDSTVLSDGTEVFLSKSAANFLNGNGVVTALNFNDWRCWGNRTSIYPTSSDVKDSFIATRRMMNFVGNTLVTTFWSKIDEPITRTLIDSVIESANLWLAGLKSSGALLGGRVEYLEEDNPSTSLLDGVIIFRVYIGAPTPAKEICFRMEYDVKYLSTLAG